MCLEELLTYKTLFCSLQIVKAIDAVSREQLIQIAASFGVGNATPVFSMVPVRARALLPTITEEDRVILNNVEKVVKFLTSGTATTTMNGVWVLSCLLFLCINKERMLKVSDIISLLAGCKHGVCSPRTSSCVAGHLIEDPTGCLEPVVIKSICTIDQRGIFVKFWFFFFLTAKYN